MQFKMQQLEKQKEKVIILFFPRKMVIPCWGVYYGEGLAMTLKGEAKKKAPPSSSAPSPALQPLLPKAASVPAAHIFAEWIRAPLGPA